MLAEMSWQAVDRSIEGNKGGQTWVFTRQACLFDLRRQVHGMREIAVRKKIGKSVENVILQIERFANLARGAASAITNHIGCHGGAMLAVTAINFLDHAFAPVATGQI